MPEPAARTPLSHRRRTGPARRAARRGTVLTALVLLTAACSPPQSAPAPAQPGTDSVRPTPTTTAPVTTHVATQRRLGIGPCPLFPDDNVFHANVSTAPRRTDSRAVIAALGGAGLAVRAGFSAGVWQGSRAGVPLNVVDSRTTRAIDVEGGTYAYASDLRGHPIPASARLEGWPTIAWDRHMLIVDTATCTASEFFHVTPPWENLTGRWRADTAIKTDLRSNTPRAGGSAMASGLSLLAGMIRYDEVASGRINHVVSITVPTIKDAPPVWPATRSDGRSKLTHAPAMGTWLRLRADIDLSALRPQARIVARALQEHGAIISDTNNHGLALAGEPDDRWDDEDLATLGTLSAQDFEVIDPTAMKVRDGSHQIR